MSQQARNNPDYQPSYLQHSSYREPLAEPSDIDEEVDADEDEPRKDSARQRWLDGVDSCTNREYL